MIRQAVAASEFVLSSAGFLSRSTLKLAQGNKLAAGTVVGTLSASGKVAPYNGAASDGTQTASGILEAPVDASGADMQCTVITRDAEVMGSLLNWSGNDSDDIDSGIADLGTVGIVVR